MEYSAELKQLIDQPNSYASTIYKILQEKIRIITCRRGKNTNFLAGPIPKILYVIWIELKPIWIQSMFKELSWIASIK